MNTNQQIKPLSTKIHECKLAKGKIRDVTYNQNGIYCRRCGKSLTDEEVNPETLEDIKNILNKRQYQR